MITGQLIELAADDVKNQTASEQSMMSAGLIATPAEMRDLIAYLQVSLNKPNRRKKKKG